MLIRRIKAQNPSEIQSNEVPVPQVPTLQPLTKQDWVNLTAPNSTSIYRGGMHIKPTDAFSSATNSKRLDGFIFVGNDDIALATSRGRFPPLPFDPNADSWTVKA